MATMTEMAKTIIPTTNLGRRCSSLRALTVELRLCFIMMLMFERDSIMLLMGKVWVGDGYMSFVQDDTLPDTILRKRQMGRKPNIMRQPAGREKQLWSQKPSQQRE